jgi:hypothetical protein
MDIEDSPIEYIITQSGRNLPPVPIPTLLDRLFQNWKNSGVEIAIEFRFIICFELALDWLEVRVEFF